MPTQSVKLIPIQPGGGQPFRWEMTHGSQKGDGTPGHPYPKVKLGANSGPNLIKFTIEGNNDYTFSSDPIWIQKGSQKPSGGVDSQIVVGPDLYNGGKTLAIVDWNTWTGDLTYQLNIPNAPANVDPVITNGGGGGSPPPPPPPPPPPGAESTAAPGSAAPASGSGMLAGFDGVSFVIGVIVGLAAMLAWLKLAK
jgi:hypothetical protein